MSVQLRGVGDDPVIYYTDPMKLLKEAKKLLGKMSKYNKKKLKAIDQPGHAHLTVAVRDMARLATPQPTSLGGAA